MTFFGSYSGGDGGGGTDVGVGQFKRMLRDRVVEGSIRTSVDTISCLSSMDLGNSLKVLPVVSRRSSETLVANTESSHGFRIRVVLSERHQNQAERARLVRTDTSDALNAREPTSRTPKRTSVDNVQMFYQSVCRMQVEGGEGAHVLVSRSRTTQGISWAIDPRSKGVNTVKAQPGLDEKYNKSISAMLSEMESTFVGQCDMNNDLSTGMVFLT